MRLSRIIILCLAATFLAQVGYFYLNLPETVASHFDGAGNPNGWMSKGSFVIFEIFLLFFVIGQFMLVPKTIEKMPNSMINLPKKDYWLAPDRRTGTINLIRIYFEWFSIMILLLFIAVNQLVYRANLHHENLSGREMWLFLAIFLAFVVVWLVKLIRYFYKP